MISSPKTVLVAPLDWGLGHATRCIPIVNEFLQRGCEVHIASNGSALILLRQEFPNLKFHELVSYNANYSVGIPFMMNILFQMPKFLLAIKKEHHQIERIIENENINLLVSDNRYGCWSAHIPSVLITHQINILMSPRWKWLEGLINYGNHQQIRKFTGCWVPDFPNGITGRMTQSNSAKIKFIGMVSRFKKLSVPVQREILFLISGPEPQRSIFESRIKKQITKTGVKNYLIVKGKLDNESTSNQNELNHLPTHELNEAIESSQLIISRSGYSTIMDLCKLGKKAVFIPTPDQTEQEYLAEQLEKNGVAYFQHQNEFDLARTITESKKHKGFEGYPHSPNLLANAIDSLLNA